MHTHPEEGSGDDVRVFIDSPRKGGYVGRSEDGAPRTLLVLFYAVAGIDESARQGIPVTLDLPVDRCAHRLKGPIGNKWPAITGDIPMPLVDLGLRYVCDRDAAKALLNVETPEAAGMDQGPWGAGREAILDVPASRIGESSCRRNALTFGLRIDSGVGLCQDRAGHLTSIVQSMNAHVA
jgi:hypothetical protein